MLGWVGGRESANMPRAMSIGHFVRTAAEKREREKGTFREAISNVTVETV
jgi:hypothetical protein